jgi:hypothetical protein
MWRTGDAVGGPVGALRAELDDPHLSLMAEGAARRERGRDLEAVRMRLEEAFSRWESATRHAEAAE